MNICTGSSDRGTTEMINNAQSTMSIHDVNKNKYKYIWN